MKPSFQLIAPLACCGMLLTATMPRASAQVDAPVTTVPITTAPVIESSDPRVMPAPANRIWLISTRHMTSNACRVNLESPELRVRLLSDCGRCSFVSVDEFVASLAQSRRTVIYVHGNRMQADDAISRGTKVYQNIVRYRLNEPIDWVIWSWPSEQIGI